MKTIRDFLNGRLPCSSLEQELIAECDDRDKRIEELQAQVDELRERIVLHQAAIDRAEVAALKNGLLCLEAEKRVDKLQRQVDEATESWHLANGVAELAMKHRDVAEKRVAELQAQVEWQPIETAPKDKEVLIFVPASRHHRASIEADYACSWNKRKPTHWKPLPKPPEAAIKGENEGAEVIRKR